MDEIKMISINQLYPFKNHSFRVETNRELYELMRSIEREGVLVPLLARPRSNGAGYELISGHRRAKSGDLAGLTEVPTVIREMTDDQAVIAMVDSNLQREHILPSEKAYAYKMKLEAMNHQGKRIEDETSVQDEPKQNNTRSNEMLAKQVGESVAQIKRYIRLTNLIPKILDMVDKGVIAFTPAVELSYLTEEEQYELHAVMDMEQCTLSLSQATQMKVISQQGKLDMDAILQILEQEKPNQREQIKIRADMLNRYFPDYYTPQQKVEVIERLVKNWHESYVVKEEYLRR